MNQHTVSFVLLILLTSVLSSSSHLLVYAEEVDLSELQCDGGWCQDGEEYILDCSGSSCAGDGWPGNFPTIIPSYDDGDWLDDENHVIGFELNGIAYAYPLVILSWYETVIDTIDDLPIIVTYCPLC